MFNQDSFVAAKFEPVTRTIPAPDLASWFEEGETPEFTVRGLTGAELARTHEAASTDATLSRVLKALNTANAGGIAEARVALGLGDETPSEIARRVAMLHIACVAPEGLLRNTVVLLAERFPILFYTLTNAISELTGEGQQEKK
jgi:hypothetical protein